LESDRCGDKFQLHQLQGVDLGKAVSPLPHSQKVPHGVVGKD
jgi:hypothetical protein